MEILKETIGGVQVGTLVIGMAIILGIVWLWSRWMNAKRGNDGRKGLNTKLRLKMTREFGRESWRKRKKLSSKPGCQPLAQTMI